MSLLLLSLTVFALMIYKQLQVETVYLNTYMLVAMLAIHIYASAIKVDNVKSLHLLGVTLLTISATAFVSIAHQTHTFNTVLFANVILLFMIVPMVPWGVREASAVSLIIYCLLTFSTSSKDSTFGADTLIALQFLMITATITSIVLVARSVSVRKDDLIARYNLEQARAHLYELSNIDPLTGAGNRRFQSIALKKIIDDYKDGKKLLHYALFDINDFKLLNDTYGHDFGDKVLECIGKTFIEQLDKNGYLIRLGGDEFALLLIHNMPEQFIEGVCTLIESKCSMINNSAEVHMSYGIVSSILTSDVDLNELYIRADKAMYENKQDIKSIAVSSLHGKVTRIHG